MNAPTERNLAFARQAATHAAFRVLLVFLLFGLADLLEGVGRLAITTLVSPGVSPDLRPIEPDASAPWQVAFTLLATLFCLLKLGILVVMFRRRSSLVPSLPIFVVLGVAGAAARLASYGVAVFVMVPRLAAGPTSAFAEWSMAASVASTVSFVLDTLMLLGVFIAAAVAVTRDAVPPEKPPTYRHAPSS